jgi:hypothetical protein
MIVTSGSKSFCCSFIVLNNVLKHTRMSYVLMLMYYCYLVTPIPDSSVGPVVTSHFVVTPRIGYMCTYILINKYAFITLMFSVCTYVYVLITLIVSVCTYVYVLITLIVYIYLRICLYYSNVVYNYLFCRVL